jgi:hypothetical protein
MLSKQRLDLTDSKIISILFCIDWLISTHSGQSSQITEWPQTNGKRPIDFSEPTGIYGYNRAVNLVLPLFRI